MQIAQRLEQLSVTREEYYLLKALVLINCDVRVESMAHVKTLRETVLAALTDCSTVLRYDNRENVCTRIDILFDIVLQAGKRRKPAFAATPSLYALHPAG